MIRNHQHTSTIEQQHEFLCKLLQIAHFSKSSHYQVLSGQLKVQIERKDQIEEDVRNLFTVVVRWRSLDVVQQKLDKVGIQVHWRWTKPSRIYL